MGQTVEVNFGSSLSRAFSLQEISLLACLRVSGALAHGSLQSPDPAGAAPSVLLSRTLLLAGLSLMPLPLDSLFSSQQLKGFGFRFNFQKSFYA